MTQPQAPSEVAVPETKDTMTHIAALEQRVTGLETGVRDVVAGLNALSSKIDANSKTSWPVIWSAMGVCFTMLCAIGTLAYMPITSSIARVDRDLDRHEAIFYSRTEAERGRALNDRAIDKIERRLEKLEDRTR